MTVILITNNKISADVSAGFFSLKVNAVSITSARRTIKIVKGKNHFNN
jgi:hypothetical protein